MPQAPTLPEIGTLSPESSETEHWLLGRPELSIRSYGLTNPGQLRSRNEDQFLIASVGPALHMRQSSLSAPATQFGACGHVYVVADGMGGHAAGDRASALVIQNIQELLAEKCDELLQIFDAAEERIASIFRDLLDQIDARVCAEGKAHPTLHGMGSTVTLAYTFGDSLYVAHVGDSRCYLLRDGRLQQVTSDHTMAAELIRSGLLSAEEALHHSWRHVITNAVGGADRGVRVEAHALTVQSGDCLLLCSDGLTDMLSDEQITEVLQSEPDPRRACETLVTQANAAGGRDNITVVVARYEE
jgi:protein phosphatase